MDHRRTFPHFFFSLPSRVVTDIFSHRVKRTLNVDTPPFKPASLAAPAKTSAISSQAANAAPFTPRGLASGDYHAPVAPSSLYMLMYSRLNHTESPDRI